MSVIEVIPQLRTSDLQASIDFYTSTLGFKLDFRFQDFYAGIRLNQFHRLHLKQVDEKDSNLENVQRGRHLHIFIQVDDVASYSARYSAAGVEFLQPLTTTDWNTTEFYILDNQGHVLCFAQEN